MKQTARQLRAVLLAASCVGAACADVGESDATDGLRTLTVELSTCGRFKMCSRTMGVEAPDQLVLHDRAGEERFTLRAPEFDAVLEIALLSAFQEAMADTDAWSCPAQGEEETTVHVEWQDGTVRQARVVDGCFGSADDPARIYDVLLQRLVELKNAYLACPLVSAIPTDIDPQNDPTPGRPLCFACFGEC